MDADDYQFFGPIGRVICHASKLEFELDGYFFLLQKKLPKMTKTLAPSFPRQYNDKIKLFVRSFIFHSPLRRLGDADGELNLNRIGYLFEQLFSARNHLAHGAIYRSESKEGLLVYQAAKYSSIKGKKQVFKKEVYRFSTSFLDRLYDECLYLKALVRNATDLLSGIDVPTELDALRKDRIKASELLEKMKDRGNQ